jgi:hypothetical protein
MMAALTYNLKKYMKFISKKAIAKAIALPEKEKNAFSSYFYDFLMLYRLFFADLCSRFWLSEIYVQKIITQ